MIQKIVAWHNFNIALEVSLCFAIVLLGIVKPTLGAGYFSFLESQIVRLSRRPWLSAMLLGLVVIGIRLALLPLIPIPHPFIHDEFSYLLSGDTFAHGRLTNQPHAFWRSFESVHILQQPTYMSMYPPGQGLFLALGQKLSSYPWTGVCLSVALMVVAIFWMLWGWFSPPLALVGASLVIVRWGIFSYWMNSYWGGAVPAIAGALILGSLPRLLRASHLRDVVALGAGIALLANSRPYEGLLITAFSLSAFAAVAISKGWFHRLLRARILGPLILILAFAAAMMLYNNSRITGTALQLPYVSDRQQYATAPLLLIEPLRPEPVYDDESLRRNYAAEAELYKLHKANWGLSEIKRKLKEFWIFFFDPLLSLPVLILLFTGSPVSNQRQRFFFTLVCFLLIGLLLEVWFYPHYAAPAVAAIVALIVHGLARMRTVNFRGRPVGLFMSRAIPVCCLLLWLLPISAAVQKLRMEYFPLQWYGGSRDVMHASPVFASLGSGGHQDLVFVRYKQGYQPGREWVYNPADIDGSPVVWARDKGPAKNAKLMRYFSGRRAWLFEVDRSPWQLQPYSPPAEPGEILSGASPASDVRR